MRKSILRVVAILACFCILSLAIPSSVCAEKKVDKIGFRFIERPTFLAISVLPFYSPIYDIGKDITLPESNKDTLNKIRITEGVVRTKPPDEDGG